MTNTLAGDGMNALPATDVLGAAYRAQSEAHDLTEQIVRDAAAFASEHEIGIPMLR